MTGTPRASDTAWWSVPPPHRNGPGPVLESAYLAMRDGVRLAVDVHRPAPIPDGGLPAILWQTRYFRRYRYHWWAEGMAPLLFKAPEIARFVSAGYVYVAVDIRGTGASFGSRAADMSEAELEKMASKKKS